MLLSFPQCLERAFRIDFLFPRSATPKVIEWRDSRCRNGNSESSRTFQCEIVATVLDDCRHCLTRTWPITL